MSKGTTFLGWVAGGMGIILLYSAYRNQSPSDVVKNALTGENDTPSVIDSGRGIVGAAVTGASAPSVGASVVGTARSQALKNRTIQPTLVPIGSQPKLLLDSSAATSFAKVEAEYGQTIWLTGSYRSYAQQAADYARSPSTHARPGKSLHEVGLAVDVHSDKMNLNDPKLVDAFTRNGWFRQGKRIGPFNTPEPWHWTYGVPG